jgi:hypothetical protein
MSQLRWYETLALLAERSEPPALNEGGGFFLGGFGTLLGVNDAGVEPRVDIGSTKTPAVRTWQLDRSRACAAIEHLPQCARSNARTAGRLFEVQQAVAFDCNVRIDVHG